MNRNAGGIWRRRCPISVLRTSICGFPLVSPQRNSWKLNLCGGKGGVALFLSRSTLLNCSDNSTWPFSSHSCQPKFISATIRGLFVLDLYCLWKAFGDSWCSKFCRTPFPRQALQERSWVPTPTNYEAGSCSQLTLHWTTLYVKFT